VPVKVAEEPEQITVGELEALTVGVGRTLRSNVELPTHPNEDVATTV
jgi:hypothetical protein